MDTNGSRTSTSEALSLTVRPDGVAVITYDVKGEAVNTLKASFAAEFQRALGEVAGNPAVKAAILVSAKPDTWIAGADVEILRDVKTAAAAEAICRAGHAAAKLLAEAPKPIVAAVHGAALGGGFEVALACHGRVLSDDKKTVLALPEVQLGLLPGMHGLQRLAEKVGLQVALDHALTGKNIRASKAKTLGIADDVVPPSILVDVACELALSLAAAGAPFTKRTGSGKKKLKDRVTRAALEENPVGRRLLFKTAREQVLKKTGGHFPAPERILAVLKTWADEGFEASAEVEARAFGELVVSDVAHRLIEIFFATTALKKETGAAGNVKPRAVNKIAVLGAGLMGSGITYVSANAGIGVRLKDRDLPSVGRGIKAVADLFDGDVKRKAKTRTERDARMALVSATTDYSGVGNADLVIEAVFEDLAVKHKVVEEVEAIAGPTLILASNTSSIPITQIASASKRPENVVGMHYFSPVNKMPLLEVIQTKQTSPEVVATAVAVGKKQGKMVIVVNDGVGFYTSRVLGPMMSEAAYLLQEGVPIHVIDKAMTAWGWPVGPITLLDEVGIDVAAHIGPIMVAAFGERLAPPATMAKLVADDRKGRKNERGFYLYGEAAKKLGKGKHVDESVYRVLDLPVPGKKEKGNVSKEEIQQRCSLQLINEAMHCWGERILRSPRDGDLGAIFGLGFPPFRGGPFRYVDGLGAGEVLKRIEGYQERFGLRWAPAPALVEMAKVGGHFYP